MVQSMLSRLFGLAVVAFFSSAFAGTVHVKFDATGTGDGSSWANAFTDLQPGIDAVQAGDEVWVAAAPIIQSPGPTVEPWNVKNIFP